MKVSIIIPVYNEEDYLPACLDAVSKQTRMPDEVIVVDNNCTDGTLKVARRYPFVRVLKEPRQGTVFARNTGFKAAKGDIMARIDADTRIPPGWVADIARTFKGNPGVAAVTGAPRFYNVPVPRFFNWGQVALYQRFEKLLTGTYMIWGANMAIRRKVWRQVAPLCAERVGIDEDIDLSLWLHKKGHVVRYMPDLAAGASLQRGRTGIRYNMAYLATWPRDYALHRMYMRTALITLITGGMMASTLAYLLILKLVPEGWRRSRRHQ